LGNTTPSKIVRLLGCRLLHLQVLLDARFSRGQYGPLASNFLCFFEFSPVQPGWTFSQFSQLDWPAGLAQLDFQKIVGFSPGKSS